MFRRLGAKTRGDRLLDLSTSPTSRAPSGVVAWDELARIRSMTESKIGLRRPSDATPRLAAHISAQMAVKIYWQSEASVARRAKESPEPED